ncbi:RteC domain-containing protein [Pedobacter sp. KLB.chiD]|uniref:RteC domain-containing protein n=1 Tax=Pedobacter sp. KLB.chiD TaxID=3387402 RepID=UPI00399AB56C
MKTYYKILEQRIKQNEQAITFDVYKCIDESRKMSALLFSVLSDLKDFVRQNGFKNESEEIEFFRKMKPSVLGKLLFYNKVYRIEIGRPNCFGPLAESYFTQELKKIERLYSDMSSSEFYKYYRSGTAHNDSMYFLRGNFNLDMGLDGYAFNSDPDFTTYYDFKISKIIETDLLYDYLIIRIQDSLVKSGISNEELEGLQWTATKSALVELIYAVYASESVNGVNCGIRKLVLIFQDLFHIELGDVHHLFHRMKYRAGNRTLFLDKMKTALEVYMDRDIS